MGTTLLKHSQFVTVENNSINIYEQNSGEYVLLKSFAYADLGIDSYYETIKSGVYDEVNKCYYMILLNSNSSYKNLGYVVKYLPETTAIVTLGSFNCTWDKYNAMKNVFPSPTNPKLFFINVYQPKSGLICLYIKDDDTITRFQVPVNYENKYAEILSYGISSNNYIFMRRSDESYGFKIDYNSNSSVALTNDTGYTICTCSQDGSVCVVFKDDIYYLAELNISNYIISIILITSLPSGYEPLIFTNVTDTLLIRDTDKSQLAFLTYKDNKFSKIYIQAVNTDFIKVSAFGTGKEFLSDGSGIFAYMTSTSGILNYLSYNTKTISSLVLDGITLYNTNGTTATANNIVEGKTAYVNGGKVEGNIKEIGGSIYSADTIWVDNDLNTLMMQDDSRDYDAVIRANGVLGIGANLDAVAEVIDLTSDKIIDGNTILGVEGTGASNYFNMSVTNETIYNFLKAIPLIDTSAVTDMSGMFAGFTGLTTIPLLDTSNVTIMESMFESCENLVSIPQVDMSKVTSTNSMFMYCFKLTDLPELNTTLTTDMSRMFQSCESLVEAPMMDTSSIQKMMHTFRDCTSLKTVPQYNLITLQNTTYMFSGCTALTEIPAFNTPALYQINFMFNGCENLVTIPQMDFSQVQAAQNAFKGCTSLSEESLNNILAMMTQSIITDTYKTLAYIGLTEEQATLCTTLSNWVACEAAGWTTGY